MNVSYIKGPAGRSIGDLGTIEFQNYHFKSSRNLILNIKDKKLSEIEGEEINYMPFYANKTKYPIKIDMKSFEEIISIKCRSRSRRRLHDIDKNSVCLYC